MKYTFLRSSLATLSVALGISIFATSCQKDIEDHTRGGGKSGAQLALQTESPGFSYDVTNNWLVFESMPAFDSVIGSIMNADPSDLDNWESGIGFTSMRSHYWTSADLIDSVDLVQPAPQEMYVDDIYFATILNPYGFVKVKDTLYKVLTDRVEKYVEGSLVDAFTFNVETTIITEDENGNVTDSTVIFGKTSSGCCNNPGLTRPANSYKSNWQKRKVRKRYWHSTRRMLKSVTWNRFYGFYASIGSKSRTYKKKYGFWWNNRVDHLGVWAKGYWTPQTFTPGAPWWNFDINRCKNNKYYVGKTVAWESGNLTTRFGINGAFYHKKVNSNCTGKRQIGPYNF